MKLSTRLITLSKIIFPRNLDSKLERGIRRFLEKYPPWNRVQLLFHGGLSRGGQQQSRIAERDAFSQASAFSLFSRIGVIGARFFFCPFFFFSFFFFCRATRSRTIYNKESVWIGSGEFFLRPAFRRRSQSALEPWENRIESRVKEDGKRESGGSPARREKSHGRRIGGLVKFIRNGFRFEWNVRRVDYFIGAEKKRRNVPRARELRNNRRDA